jgi:hypothetical protein
MIEENFGAGLTELGDGLSGRFDCVVAEEVDQ